MLNFILCRTKFGCCCHFGIVSVAIVLLCAVSRIHSSTESVEDGYNKHFGNHSYYRCWKQAKAWYVDDDEPLLRKFCAQAHNVSGKGSYPIDWIMWRERSLKFKNPKYVTRRVDVVEYTVNLEGSTTPITDTYVFWKNKLESETNKFALAEGKRPDCVYFLNLDSQNGSQRVFTLKEEVCGVEIVDDTIKPPLPDVDLGD